MSGTVGCREPDTQITFAEMSENSDSNSPRGRGGRVGFSSEHPPMDVVEATGRSAHREDADEK